MNLRDILLALFATRALAQTSVSEQDYETLCMDKDGVKDEIIPGYWVEYKCDHLGPNDGQQIQDISSARECAQLCKDRSGCEGSSWDASYLTCTLSGSRRGRRTEFTLYMKDVTPATPPTTGNPPEGGNQAAAAVCDRLRDQCLREMRTSGCSCGAGNGDPSDGIEQPDESPSGETQKMCIADNSSDKKIITIGGSKYKIYCNSIAHGENDLGVFDIKDVTLEECIVKCNNTRGCVRAIVKTDRTKCYLRSHGNDATPNAPGWHSAHLV